jgi:DNA-binding MarR family transcriptional regulator/GNAT superfamily N-acetyltransferase
LGDTASKCMPPETWMRSAGKSSSQGSRSASGAAMRIDSKVAAVRKFNRFYTKKIGVLSESLLESPFSLTEVRVLYELAHRSRTSASDLIRELGLDAGYLSRILQKFAKRGLIEKRRSEEDARASVLKLTQRGRTEFEPLESGTNSSVRAMMEPLSGAEQRAVVASMETIERVLGGTEPSSVRRGENYVLRGPEAGDLGWIVHRHGVLYRQEYGYDERFEALVAEIAGEFVKKFDAKRERCWIAERDGEIAGSVFVVKKSEGVAKLRLLLVEPSARGLGIGKRLVNECIQFARQAGYKKMILWTQSELLAARNIYKAAGFRRTGTKAHESFGKKLVAEVWEIRL